MIFVPKIWSQTYIWLRNNEINVKTFHEIWTLGRDCWQINKDESWKIKKRLQSFSLFIELMISITFDIWHGWSVVVTLLIFFMQSYKSLSFNTSIIPFFILLSSNNKEESHIVAAIRLWNKCYVMFYYLYHEGYQIQERDFILQKGLKLTILLYWVGPPWSQDCWTFYLLLNSSSQLITWKSDAAPDGKTPVSFEPFEPPMI